MNIFRFLGDISHILSFVILLNKIVKGKSSVGISLRTQEMYAGEHSAAHLLYSCFGCVPRARSGTGAPRRVSASCADAGLARPAPSRVAYLR